MSMSSPFMKKPWKPQAGSAPTSGSEDVHAGDAPSARARTTPLSVRGRISGPIQIPSPMDDDFPLKHSSNNSSSALREEALAGQARPEEHEVEQEAGIKQSGATSRTQVVRSSSIPNFSSRHHHATVSVADPPAPMESTLAATQDNPSTNYRQSFISSRTGNTHSSNDRQNRKKSGLRGALGKLFGRKKKNMGQATPEPEARPRPDNSALHLSDPSMLARQFNGPPPKRSPSLPVKSYGHTLRSHSAAPGDVLSARNSLGVEYSLSNSRVQIKGGLPLLNRRSISHGEIGGLAPRPASTHGRGVSRLSRHEEDTTHMIGRAVSSDMLGLKRRSRSMSGLPQLEESSHSIRRRSDEIRYWREGHDAPIKSPVDSSNPCDNEDVGTVAEEPIDSSEFMGGNPGEVHRPPTPPQPFNFGDLTTMNQMAGMRITEAASLDNRVGRLEVRARRLEKVVNQIHASVMETRPQTVPSSEGDGHTGRHFDGFSHRQGEDTTPSTRPSTDQSGLSRTSFGDAPTFVGSIARSTRQLEPTGTSNRPTSTTTIRGAASLPSLSKEAGGPLTMDHYSTLHALIETERSARLALEAQVKRMGYQISLMSKAAEKQSLGSRIQAPGTSYSEISIFEDDDDEGEDVNDPDGTVKSIYGRRQRQGANAADFKGDDRASQHKTSLSLRRQGSSTPRSSIFTEDLGNDAPDQTLKKTKTLSLSKLTLGKAMSKSSFNNNKQGPPTPVNC